MSTFVGLVVTEPDHGTSRPQVSAEMTRAELVDAAKSMGIKVPARATKAQIIELMGGE